MYRTQAGVVLRGGTRFLLRAGLLLLLQAPLLVYAAEELNKAELSQDARLFCQTLLQHEGDAKQRAVIERNIQQLWLIETKATLQ